MLASVTFGELSSDLRSLNASITNDICWRQRDCHGTSVYLLLLQLRKPTQVPITSIFATSIMADQARISCIFKALLSQVHTVSNGGHDPWNSGWVSAGRNLCHCHQELPLQLSQVKKGRSCSILLKVLGYSYQCRSWLCACSTPSWEVCPQHAAVSSSSA